MRKVFAATVVAFLASLGLALVASPASADVACDTVTVEGRTGPDSGENGNDWATTKITRVLKVCATEAAEGDWTYNATVTDSGEFTTLAGESPGKDLVTIKAGLIGTVNGGFKATFTAPEWDGTLEKPDPQTSTGKWIETAFPGARFTEAGSVADWGWTYNRCGENGEWWVNAESGNRGDIVGAPCVVTPVKPTYTEPTCEAAGVVTPATSKGIEYTRTEADGKVTVTATAKDGYELQKDAEARWTFNVAKLTGDACLTEVELAKPEVKADCDGIWYTTPDDDKATYEVTDAGPGWFVLTATLKDGYRLKEGTVSEWKLEYIAPTDCEQTPTPNPTPNPGGGNGGGETPSAAPSTSNVAAGGELPVTGSSKSTMLYLLGGGLMLVAIGGGAVLYARRNRDEVEFTS